MKSAASPTSIMRSLNYCASCWSARDKLDDAKLDTYVEQIAAPIIAAIDCTKCANCCRSLDVYLVEDDARRLADGLMIPLDAVETRYIDHESAAEVEEWGKFRQRPCAFLDGKLCSVYAHRPESCRLYPAFTPDFRWTLDDTIEGASLCPIIYNVLVASVRAAAEATASLKRLIWA